MGTMELISLLIGALSAYWGAHTAVKVELARMDERIKSMKENFDSDHARLSVLESKVK